MKRKLDVNDAPAPTSDELPTQSPESLPEEEKSFRKLGLDWRILQAISKLKFKQPTPIQEKVIPLAMNGQDILARALTGSGKTAAYLLPVINSILRKKNNSSSPSVSSLILVPTRELAEQVLRFTESFCVFCANEVRSINISQKVSDSVLQSLLADCPDIVIATPSKASLVLKNTWISPDKIAHLVIDEADLVLSYGYEEDLQSVAKFLPKGVQTFLISATLTNEVEILKGLFCRNPIILKLDEDNRTESLSQFVVRCAEEEKFLLIYVIFKLKLIRGKCIVFVEDIDRCYRVKLFLEQFGIRSCVLNSELPVNSRIHVVDEFNKGVYDIIIASDEIEMLGNEDLSNGDEKDPNCEENRIQQSSRKKHKPTKKSRDYGVSRGVDFKNVACVLNFDLPTSSKSYIHRIGRTARAGQSGMALSFVIPSDQYRKHPPTSIESTKNDEKVLARIIKHQSKQGREVKPYKFDMNQVAAFRYRLNDALKAVTTLAIREARTKELRLELIKSDKLRQYFEENPGELYHLRHDTDLRPASVRSHMRHIPNYLLPNGGKNLITASNGNYKGLPIVSKNRIRKARMSHKSRGNKMKSRKAEPLKNFRVKS
ncbi:ATP-dependent RNA helicase dbp9 [Erysiphe necator]|uniref:RNA helicase n=1 Tax=Uncinula necator TaxID=52586 RepID=A0A0B1PAB6_UNCNE|nr:ATP-dependent RNA helicase dbp9 [Erysiphe necator]KHJ35642.1 putative atp-dependent rna helicase dbp9 [Erysiphe necator]